MQIGYEMVSNAHARQLSSSYNLGHKGWEFPFFSNFAPPHPCAMLTKHFDLTQVCILLFSKIEGGMGVLALM